MAARPQEDDSASVVLERLHAYSVRVASRRCDDSSVTAGSTAESAAASPRHEAPRRARGSRRGIGSSIGLIGVALALVVAGGAMLSTAHSAPSPRVDPPAHTAPPVSLASPFSASTRMLLS